MSFFENTPLELIYNIYTSWKKCKDNHTYIENIYNTNIILNNQINISNNIYNFEKDIETNKRTIYFDKCNNLNIYINEKFNHILLVNCTNINIYLSFGLISGLDVINCKNINININKKIDYTEISNSEDCNYIYNIFNEDYTFINTNNCFNINLLINNFNYITNRNYFAEKKYFVINKNYLKCYDNHGNEINL